MNYIVNNEYNYEFETVKRIGIWIGKIFHVYKDDTPFLSVEVNKLIGDFFIDSIINGDYLYIGNYYEGVYVINLKDFTFNRVSVDGYFGYFVKKKD